MTRKTIHLPRYTRGGGGGIITLGGGINVNVNGKHKDRCIYRVYACIHYVFTYTHTYIIYIMNIIILKKIKVNIHCPGKRAKNI